MGTTTPNAYPYPEDGDPVAQGAQAIKALAQRIEAVWASAWTTFASAVTGTNRYRVVGSIVFVHVSGSFASNNGQTHNLTTGPLPAAVRPSISIRGYAFFTGFPGTLTVGIDGVVSCVQNSGAARADISGLISYPLG